MASSKKNLVKKHLAQISNKAKIHKVCLYEAAILVGTTSTTLGVWLRILNPDLLKQLKLNGEEKLRKPRKSNEEMDELAESRGLAFIGNFDGEYWWKCRNGHQWSSIPSSIRVQTGCKACKQQGQGYRETICRFIFEELTGKKFPKTRAILGQKFELDGYCKELAIAFEYQGEQHYNSTCYWNTLSSFEDQKRRDRTKIKLCRKAEVMLVEVPYTVAETREQIETFIRTKLKDLSIPTVKSRVNWSKFCCISHTFDDLKVFASQKGFTCQSQVYLGSWAKLEWKCRQGHIWFAAPANIRTGWGCPHCSGCARKTIEDMHKLAETRGFKFLSETYTNVMMKYKWECSKGHIWEAAANDIQQGRGCRACFRLTQKSFRHTEETKQRISKSHKGKKVSEETKSKISRTKRLKAKE